MQTGTFGVLVINKNVKKGDKAGGIRYNVRVKAGR